MKKFKNLLLVVFAFFTTVIFAQTKLKGVVVDETGQPLPGASVVEKGTTNGTATDFDGIFTLNTKSNSGALIVSFVGYANKNIEFTKGGDLGQILLAANTLDEVVIVGKGVVDLVKERETPVAVSTIKSAEIQEKMGNQEFPEILKSTPSIYATKSSGGFGDSRINVRGFDQRNTAVIINGQPVNDMENGKVYWSNWSGLQDVASAVQIQRGLGASKLAVPSVGGTINIVTKAAEKKQGGFVKTTVGNDNYFKTTVSYNTGVFDDTGWSASALLGRWQGDGYIDGTAGAGYTYFVALGYKMTEHHSFNFSFTGSGQWHNQRSFNLTVADQLYYGKKYNADWGYLNGKEYSFEKNFYNKPITSLNWDWDINDKLSLSTVVYGSWGRGGGTGIRGGNKEIFPYKVSITDALVKNIDQEGNFNTLDFRTPNGLIDFEKVVANNRSGAGYSGANEYYKGLFVGSNQDLYTSNGAGGYVKNTDGINSNIAVRRSSMNSHNWYGGITNLKYELDDWTFGLGADLRTYEGFHYRVLNDLLGLDAYFSTGDKNDISGTYYTSKGYATGGKFITETVKALPFKDTGLNTQKIDFYTVGRVNWIGTNAIVEYNNQENLSAVLQGGLSNKKYQRIDHFDQLNNVESDEKHVLGGYVKGGVNYNIDEKHNVFANAGLIKRQPNFDAVFPNYANIINDEVKNETILSYELGYGFKSALFSANLNLYRSSWKDRWITQSYKVGNQEGTANFPGIEQLHQGVELELTAKPIEKLKLTASGSYGDWVYAGNVTSSVFNNKREKIAEKTVYLKDVKVGDAAQFTASLGATYEILENFKVDANWNYTGNLYADFSPVDSTFDVENNNGALKLPDYNLFDAGVSYKYNLSDKYALSFRVNVNNVFDTTYISESTTNIHATQGSKLYDGVDVRNQVWFGFGRTWNTSVTFSF